MRSATDTRAHEGSTKPRRLRAPEVLAFWAPLAATWLMMAVEGPYVAAIIARLRDAEVNLAAYGVAFSFAFMAEAPIIMMMTAANALVKDRDSLIALRRFLFLLNGSLTLAMALVAIPPVFRFLAETAIGLRPDIAHLTHGAVVFLVLWPAAIGYRRFYQGILVRHHLPRRVAYGTIVRLVTMSAVAPTLAFLTPLPGASIGAIALAGGVLAEAAASRWMAAGVVRRIMSGPGTGTERVTLPEIARFYVPLALTSLLAVVVNPLLTFLMGRSRSPVESLAVLPVVTGFAFIFRSGALAYQEVGVALIGTNRENRGPVARTAVGLAAASAVGLVAVLFTPLGPLWLEDVAGLSPALAAFALWPARILALLPALDYVLVFRRSLLVLARRTRWITAATAVEATAIFVTLLVGIGILDLPGAVAAASATLLGRAAGNLFLVLAARDAANGPRE
jgi:progressive ankylosis protein